MLLVSRSAEMGEYFKLIISESSLLRVLLLSLKTITIVNAAMRDKREARIVTPCCVVAVAS